MNNFENKYKDRDPKETINIIQSFFEQRGYKILIKYYDNEYIGVYSCHIQLKIEDKIILFANGKGVSKELSLASGMAELYEVFCNKTEIYSNYYTVQNLINKNLNNFNYNLHSKEKILNFYDLLDIPIFNQFLNAFFENDIYLQQRYVNLICNNKIIGIPAQGFNVNKTLYIEPRLLVKMNLTTGDCAGNTLEEALNQGISEFFERYAVNEFYKNEQKVYYYIPIKNIKNNKLQSILNKIEEQFKIYIIDLSYNFNVPVIMCLIIDQNDCKVYTSFGSFPDYNIAIERCLTEIYQGIQVNTNTKYNFTDKIQMCSQDFKWYDFFGSHYKEIPFINESIISKLIEINDFSNIFIDKEYNNLTLNNYYKDLCSKLNINLYYIDNSLSKDVKAIKIFADNLIPQDYLLFIGQENINYSLKNWILDTIEIQQSFLDLDIEILFKKIISLNFSEIIKLPYLKSYYNVLNQGEILSPYIQTIFNPLIEVIESILKDKIEYLNDYTINTSVYYFLYQSIKKFLFINEYKHKNLIYLSNILDLNITYEDIEYFENKFYILDNFIVSILQKELTSSHYITYITSLQENNNV